MSIAQKTQLREISRGAWGGVGSGSGGEDAPRGELVTEGVELLRRLSLPEVEARLLRPLVVGGAGGVAGRPLLHPRHGGGEEDGVAGHAVLQRDAPVEAVGGEEVAPVEGARDVPSLRRRGQGGGAGLVAAAVEEVEVLMVGGGWGGGRAVGWGAWKPANSSAKMRP